MSAASTQPHEAMKQMDQGALSSSWLRLFRPRWGMRNAHVQTIFGNYLRRPQTVPVPVPEPLIVPVEEAHTFQQRDGSTVPVPASSVLCLCHWQPAAVRQQRLTVVLVHGLEGSASSGYVLGNTARLWAAGCNIVRMNMRSCGGSDALSPTIYHSGRSEDVATVVTALVQRFALERIALIGYSMGGNLVLRYAGEAGASVPQLCAVVGVSPLMDLAPSSAALHQWSNRLYEQRFLRAMKRRLRLKAALFPALYASLAPQGVYERIRTMRDFDGEIVARFGSFADADDYYERVRCSRYADRFQIPTLILHADDDPFIRLLPATRQALRSNPAVDYVETAHGGHCAFLAQPDEAGQDRWAEETLARWLAFRAGPQEFNAESSA